MSLTSAPAPLLEVQNLTRRFGALAAVNDVSFSVGQAEIFGIAGPNGSGKSTLFNIITGIPFGPSSGRIVFRGKEIQKAKPFEISAGGLIRTFQKDAEFPTLTAMDNVLCAAVYCGGLSGEAAREATLAALESVSFDPARADHKAMELSVYERKQLMIASAIAGKPSLLLLDEPAAGLTRPEIADLGQLVMSVQRRGIAVLLIEHVLTLLLKVSERLMILNNGKILTIGEPEAVVADPRVVEAYLGKREARP